MQSVIFAEQILQSAFHNGSAMECEQVSTMHVRHRIGWDGDAVTAVKLKKSQGYHLDGSTLSRHEGPFWATILLNISWKVSG